MRRGVNVRIHGGRTSGQRAPSREGLEVGAQLCIQGRAKVQGGQWVEEGHSVSGKPDAQSLVTNTLKGSVSLRVMGSSWGPQAEEESDQTCILKVSLCLLF